MNYTTLKPFGLLVAFVLTLALSTKSYADTDTVRDGRFVWHKASASLDPTRGRTATPATDTNVVYDKGDLGKYVRQGRFVWREAPTGLNPTRGKTASRATDTSVVYDKGNLGKYTRQGRFVSKM